MFTAGGVKGDEGCVGELFLLFLRGKEDGLIARSTKVKVKLTAYVIVARCVAT